jgi:hypothetical protein
VSSAPATVRRLLQGHRWNCGGRFHEFCRGVNRSQAANSRLDLKCERPVTVVAMAVAVINTCRFRKLRPLDSRSAANQIRRMSFENPLWGVPKIHGELLKLGIDIAQSTISIYMVPRQGRPLQTWKIFLRNHVEEVASIDLFVVPTIAFRQLFAFLVLGHRRRQMLGFAMSQNPKGGANACLDPWRATSSLRSNLDFGRRGQ